MKYLIIAIINLIYGVLLFTTLTRETPGIMITVTVAAVLVIFGIWGVVLWFKMTLQSHRDKISHSESMEGWWKMVRAFDVILIIGLFFRFFVVQPFVVDGPSMEPNFHDKEAILVDKISLKIRPPERGEVIIFKAPPQPSDDYIKRIIGLPGETVTIEKGNVYINDKLLSEAYLSSDGQIAPDEYDQKTLAQDEYFVMGDNRPHSSDSRHWGSVPKKDLIGRASLVVYPLDIVGIVRNPKPSF